MKFVSRSEWGAKYGRGPTNITPGKGGVTVHYEGGGKLTGAAHSKCAQRVRNIESYHVNHNGWAGIAYTALVCEHGYVFEGRGLGHRTAANGTNNGNQNWYAVCALIGDKDPLGADLLRGLRDAIEWCRDGGAARRVNGHRDHLATSCPGDRLYAWVRAGMPADIEEDDVSAKDVWEYRIKTDDNQTMKAGTVLGHMEKSQDRIEALLVGLASKVGADVDEDAIVAGVLAGLTPEKIAEAIPAELAEQVVSALAARLAPKE